MTTPRVLYVCHGHPDLHPGGTEILAHDLFSAVKAAGAAPTFLGCVSNLHRGAREGTELQGVRGAADELLLWVGGFDRLMLGHTRSIPFGRAFGDLLGQIRPDVVHFHHLTMVGLEALVMVRRLVPEARIVVTLHDYHLICANDGLLFSRSEPQVCRQPSNDGCHRCFPEIEPRRFAARRLQLAALLDLVDCFVAPSRHILDRHVAWGIPAQRFKLIRNGVPASPMGLGVEDAMSAHVGPAERGHAARFGVFGNVAPHKGTVVAVDAARMAASAGLDLTLKVHGGLGFQTEPFRARFASAMAAAADVAVACGAYGRDQIGRLMHGVDWVVVPSVWGENAPLVVSEAFRYGRPVICSRIGGLPELVQDGINGLLVEPGDAPALARAMRRAAGEPGLWQRLVSGIPYVPTTDGVAERYLDLYQALSIHKEALSA
jgi:glycosyltransferase involved in cell wall biosynthesis